MIRSLRITVILSQTESIAWELIYGVNPGQQVTSNPGGDVMGFLIQGNPLPGHVRVKVCIRNLTVAFGVVQECATSR